MISSGRADKGGVAASSLGSPVKPVKPLPAGKHASPPITCVPAVYMFIHLYLLLLYLKVQMKRRRRCNSGPSASLQILLAGVCRGGPTKSKDKESGRVLLSSEVLPCLTQACLVDSKRFLPNSLMHLRSTVFHMRRIITAGCLRAWPCSRAWSKRAIRHFVLRETHHVLPNPAPEPPGWFTKRELLETMLLRGGETLG
eukprot:180137-Pelagomonas_calceolata.AAC.2